MMMTMIVFNKQQHISMVSRQTIASVRAQVKSGLNNRSLACGQCWLLSDWYCIGCQNDKKYPPILSNTCEYCPVPSNNPIPVSSNPKVHFYYMNRAIIFCRG